MSTTGFVRFKSRVLHWAGPHCSAEDRMGEASLMVVLLCVCVCVCVCVYNSEWVFCDESLKVVCTWPNMVQREL